MKETSKKHKAKVKKRKGKEKNQTLFIYFCKDHIINKEHLKRNWSDKLQWKTHQIRVDYNLKWAQKKKYFCTTKTGTADRSIQNLHYYNS